MLETVIYINASLTFLINSLLIFLILKKSPKILENYKYLLLIFSVLAILVGIIDLTNQPSLHMQEAGSMIFSRNPLGLPHNFATAYVAFNNSAFGAALCLLSFHLIYRYLAVCKPQLLYLVSFPYFFIFIFIFLFVWLDYWVISTLLGGETPEKDEFWRDSMYETFGLKIGEFAYISTIITRTDPNGNIYHSWPDVIVQINIKLLTLLGFATILFFGIKIHRKLHEKSGEKSQKTIKMQKQLFHALIVQTIIPIVLILGPMIVLLLVPMFQLKVGGLENFVIPVITSFPYLDAICTIYFINAYRNSVLTMFSCKKVKISAESESGGQTLTTAKRF